MTEPAEPVLAIESSAVTVRRVLVLKLDHRGDFIMATPAFEALRAAFPAAHITLVCGTWNVEEAAAAGLFDRVLGFGFFPEFVHQGNRVIGDDASRLAFAGLLAGERFDLAIDLRLHGDTRALLQLVDAGLRAGFDARGRFSFLDVALPFGDGAGQGTSLARRIGAEQFGANVGEADGLGVISRQPLTDRAPGDILFYGPYATLEPGEWDVSLGVSALAEPFALGFDVVAAGGAVLGAGEIAVEPGGGPSPRIALYLEEEARELEIRLRVGAAGVVPPFRFRAALLRRHGRFTGPHQAEMQYLLCCLVGLRLKQFWRIAEAGA